MSAALYDDGIAGAPKTKPDDHISKMLALHPGDIAVGAKEYQTGYAANDRGLKYQIEGRATRIEVSVGNSLATYQDPIKVS